MAKISDLLDQQLFEQLEGVVVAESEEAEKVYDFSPDLSPTTTPLTLDLKRPLIVFDLETTGVNPYSDRIVEIGAVKQFPDGHVESLLMRINPDCEMTAAVIAVHGITNEMVADAPKFREVAARIYEFFADCDLGGFGLLKFDVPVLREEFRRADIFWDLEHVDIIDALRIYHTREPRNLTSALRFYCNETLENAHSAFADAEATFKVIGGQLQHYQDLPRDLEQLDQLCNPHSPDKVDADGKLRWEENEVVINFGSKSGISLRQLVRNEPNFLRWMLNKGFSEEVKAIVRDALKGNFPTR